MSAPVDRARVEALLKNSDFSFRAIAREVGCSDWTVRKIDRDLNGDSRSTNSRYSEGDDLEIGLAGWIGIAVTIAVFGLCWLSRSAADRRHWFETLFNDERR